MKKIIQTTKNLSRKRPIDAIAKELEKSGFCRIGRKEWAYKEKNSNLEDEIVIKIIEKPAYLEIVIFIKHIINFASTLTSKSLKDFKKHLRCIEWFLKDLNTRMGGKHDISTS